MHWTLISASILNKQVVFNAGYTYTHNYETNEDTHSVFTGFSIGTDSETKNTDTKFGANVAYSFKELEEGENWRNRITYDFSISGNLGSTHRTKQVTKNREPYLADVSHKDFESKSKEFDWTLKPMKLSASFPSHAPYLSMERTAYERMLEKLFGIKVYPK